MNNNNIIQHIRNIGKRKIKLCKRNKLVVVSFMSILMAYLFNVVPNINIFNRYLESSKIWHQYIELDSYWIKICCIENTVWELL